MFDNDSKNKMFSRYNTSVLAVFASIVLIAFVIGIARYFIELDLYRKTNSDAVAEDAKLLNSKLVSNVESLLSIQQFANYYLAYPKELAAKMPEFAQEGDQYYLVKPKHDVIERRNNLSSNITGQGRINLFSKEHQQELIMANALTPAFIAAQRSNSEAIWLYYVSINQFVSLYPWVGRNSWQYSDRIINNAHFERIMSSGFRNETPFWSAPYLDSIGTGLNTALGIGVFRGQSFVGAVIIDISLSSLHNSLPVVAVPNQGLVLLNQQNNVMVHRDNTNKTINKQTQIQEVMPIDLAQLTSADLQNFARSTIIGDWLIEKQSLEVNGWTLLKYQRYEDFIAPLYSRFLSLFLVLFLVLFTLFIIVYWVTYRTFIKPTQLFISHIEYSAQGDPGKIKPTNDWRYWFKIVEDIFGQNRSLLQQLTEQNTLLDSRVSEKTQALQLTVAQHQRDYALLRSVMDAIPEYILFNDLSGCLIGCNKAFEQFTQSKEQQILGSQAKLLLPNELGKAIGALSLTESKNAHQVIATNKHTFEIYSAYIYNDASIALGTINIVRDVTKQYAIQAALKNAKNHAVFANKAKSQFLANMSHEIRTPINAIQGMISLLNKTSLNSHQLQYLDNALSASESLLYLVDELLDLAKIESGKMSIVKSSTNIDGIVEKAIRLNIAMANRKQLNVIVDIASDVPAYVLTDEMRLVQVLTNLLNNSVKFTHSGQICLTVTVVKKLGNEVSVRFSIQDTGIGVAKNTQKYLFEAFRQADESMTRRYGGSGLGLSICKQIINLLGGDINLSSQLDQGSEFSFVLPFEIVQEKALVNLKGAAFTIGVVGVNFPQSVIESIAALGWHFLSVNSLEELNQQTVFGDLVVVTDNNPVNYLSHNQVTHPITLLAICQPPSEAGNNLASENIDNLPIPSVLLESPLYRHLLIKIGQVMATTKSQLVAENKPKTSPLVSTSLAGINILLVEDNPVNQLVAKEMLKMMSANVLLAENGQLALDLLEKHLVDVVLMDIQMPVMDGLTATKLIRQQARFQSLPIIAMTAHARQEDRDQSLLAGMNMHIAKPVKAEQLSACILQVYGASTTKE